MRRREFITLLGGAAASWPLVASAQQSGRMRRIGVLMAFAESSSTAQAWVGAFRDSLAKFGWTEGRNLQIDYRWATPDANLITQSAKELVALAPDLILSSGSPTTAALQQLTRIIPIIFAIATEPVSQGFVASMARPGGNITGFINLPSSITGKYLELLREIAPRVTRVAIFFNPVTAPYFDVYVPPFKTAAVTMGVEPIIAPIRSMTELESVAAALAREPNGGLIGMPDGFNTAPSRGNHVVGGSPPTPCGSALVPRGEAMKRREFITLLGGAAAAWPLSAACVQQPAMPVIGVLGGPSAAQWMPRVEMFQQSLREFGYIEGRNLRYEYRWADGQNDRLPALAAELVRRQVSVIYTTGADAGTLAAKSATTTIPIVFTSGSDPVAFGLVASMSRPGGNVTGTSLFTSALGPKRLEILREVVPQASVVGFLQDPQGLHALYTATELESAAHKIGVRIVVVHASVENDLDAVFAKLVSAGAQGLILNADATFFGWQNRLVMLTARHAIPTISIARVYARAGLLMSYGTSDISELYRQAAGYVARVLKGEKPADLPVQGPTKFELVVNLNPIAKAVETMLQAEP